MNSDEKLVHIFGVENSFSIIPRRSFQLSQSIEPETYEWEKSILTEELRTLSLLDDESESLGLTQQNDFRRIKKDSEMFLDQQRKEALWISQKIDKVKLSKSFSIHNNNSLTTPYGM